MFSSSAMIPPAPSRADDDEGIASSPERTLSMDSTGTSDTNSESGIGYELLGGIGVTESLPTRSMSLNSSINLVLKNAALVHTDLNVFDSEHPEDFDHLSSLTPLSPIQEHATTRTENAYTRVAHTHVSTSSHTITNTPATAVTSTTFATQTSLSSTASLAQGQKPLQPQTESSLYDGEDGDRLYLEQLRRSIAGGAGAGAGAGSGPYSPAKPKGDAPGSRDIRSQGVHTSSFSSSSSPALSSASSASSSPSPSSSSQSSSSSPSSHRNRILTAKHGAAAVMQMQNIAHSHHLNHLADANTGSRSGSGDYGSGNVASEDSSRRNSKSSSSGGLTGSGGFMRKLSFHDQTTATGGRGREGGEGLTHSLHIREQGGTADTITTSGTRFDVCMYVYMHILMTRSRTLCAKFVDVYSSYTY